MAKECRAEITRLAERQAAVSAEGRLMAALIEIAIANIDKNKFVVENKPYSRPVISSVDRFRHA